MTAIQVVSAVAAIALGTTVQGTVGFGAALLAAPLLELIDPRLVPGPISIPTIAFGLLMISRERGGAHWRSIRWPALGLLPGAVIGAMIVRMLSGTASLTVFSASLVLVAVGLSAVGLHPRRRRGPLVIGGAASGFMATSVGIGGPPVALFFQHASGPEIRGALARFFILSSLSAIAMLTVFGQFGPGELLLGVLLIPGTFIGFALSAPIARHLDRGHVRVAVLTLSTLSALAAILRVVFR